MPLIDADELRETFDIASQIKDARLTFCIENASRTLVSWVGSDAYEDAGAATPDDADRAAALVAAEKYLSMYHALLNTGARIRMNGVVKSEQDAGGPMNGTIVNQYYSPAELNALRLEYLAQAEVLAAEFREVDSVQTGAHTITMTGGWRKVTDTTQIA